jgi:hypothetical protein
MASQSEKLESGREQGNNAIQVEGKEEMEVVMDKQASSAKEERRKRRSEAKSLNLVL